MSKKPNGKRTFTAHFLHNGCFGGEIISDATIEIDERVFGVVNDEWRSSFYPLFTACEIAEHICYNMVVNKLTLSQMDGFAHMFNEYAKITAWPSLDDWDVTATEIIDTLPIPFPRIEPVDD